MVRLSEYLQNALPATSEREREERVACNKRERERGTETNITAGNLPSQLEILSTGQTYYETNITGLTADELRNHQPGACKKHHLDKSYEVDRKPTTQSFARWLMFNWHVSSV